MHVQVQQSVRHVQRIITQAELDVLPVQVKSVLLVMHQQEFVQHVKVAII